MLNRFYVKLKDKGKQNKSTPVSLGGFSRLFAAYCHASRGSETCPLNLQPRNVLDMPLDAIFLRYCWRGSHVEVWRTVSCELGARWVAVSTFVRVVS